MAGESSLRGGAYLGVVSVCLVASLQIGVDAQEIQLLQRKPDPYGYPRPAKGAINVPVETSFFFQLGFAGKDATDSVLLDSVTVEIGTGEGTVRQVLRPGRRFSSGYSGKVFAHHQREPAAVVYFESDQALQPATSYKVTVGARSRNGAILAADKGNWQFTTEDPATTQAIEIPLDLGAPLTRWRGGFFTGFCKPSFCTSAANRIPGYELMSRIRAQYPRSWSLQRDIHLTATEHQPKFLINGHANVVRERETRHIVSMEPGTEGVVLNLEDLFGHQQYGIAGERPLRDDYQSGDAVLIADGVSHARANVLKILQDTKEGKRLLVSSFDTPETGWHLDYTRVLPTKEDPNAPGLFAVGGCYLSKLRPSGTPHYYWGRVDKEWDIAHRRFGRRLVVNFTEAPGDLSVDGGNWTYPKDYIKYHQVTRAYTTHLIDRYGDSCLDFYWSVFNEPDLASAFWRSRDWDQLQRFYDYTVDAILPHSRIAVSIRTELSLVGWKSVESLE